MVPSPDTLRDIVNQTAKTTRRKQRHQDHQYADAENGLARGETEKFRY
jgi:hypothetical protein